MNKIVTIGLLQNKVFEDVPATIEHVKNLIFENEEN